MRISYSTLKNQKRFGSQIVVPVFVCMALFIAGLGFSGSASAQTPYGNSISRVPQAGSWVAQNEESKPDYRSKAEVMRDVKRRYDARVLKITLNRQRDIYRVRVLMPNGKVRNITVSALK